MNVKVDPKFLSLVKSKTVAALKIEFKGEFNCYRAMRGRERKGECTVHPSIRNFKDFLICLGPRPNQQWTVDRINTFDKEYAAGKIRWADKRQQVNNRKNTTFLTLDGETRALADWARLTGQPANSIRQRLKRGWSHTEAIKGDRVRGSEQTGSPTQDQLERWPEGLQANIWETGYRAWLKALERPVPDATRKMFCTWVMRNDLRRLRKILEQRYPGFSDGQDELPALADSDPNYSRYLRLTLIHADTAKSLGHGERLFLSRYRDIPACTPQEAAAAAKKSRSVK